MRTLGANTVALDEKRQSCRNGVGAQDSIPGGYRAGPRGPPAGVSARGRGGSQGIADEMRLAISRSKGRTGRPSRRA